MHLLQIISYTSFVVGVASFIFSAMAFKTKDADDRTALLKEIRFDIVAISFMVFGIGVKLLFP